MIQLQSNMRIRHYIGGTGPNARAMLRGVATGQCRNNPQTGVYECEIMRDEINRTKLWKPRTELTAIGNTGNNSIENKPQAWIDNMMAQRGSVIGPNFNSIHNTPAVNKQWNKLMIQQGLPHRVGTGTENLEAPYLSQADCPPGATFDDGGRPPGQNSAMNKCIPPTSQADCPADSVFQDSSHPDGPQCLLTPPFVDDGNLQEEEVIISSPSKEAGFLKGNLPAILIVGGFLYYAYSKGLLTK